MGTARRGGFKHGGGGSDDAGRDVEDPGEGGKNWGRNDEDEEFDVQGDIIIYVDT